MAFVNYETPALTRHVLHLGPANVGLSRAGRNDVIGPYTGYPASLVLVEWRLASNGRIDSMPEIPNPKMAEH